ncbi:MAG: 3D domain-containing protein [Bdellovibrionales bacterium]
MKSCIFLISFLLCASAHASFQKDPRVAACLDKNHKPKAQIPPVGNQPVTDPSAAIPSCAQGDMNNLKAALTNQLRACENKSPSEQAQTFRFGCREVEMRDYCINTNQQLLDLAKTFGGDLLGFMRKARQNFDVYRMDGPTGLTGYYAPNAAELQVFTNPNDIPATMDPVQILGPPANLKLIPDNVPANCGTERFSGNPIKWCLEESNGYTSLPTAEAISAGALQGKAALLGYMSRDDFERLKLEGAGEVAVKDKSGHVAHVKANYGGQNGQQGNLLKSIVTCMKEVYGDATPPITNLKTYLKWKGIAYGDALKYNENYPFFDLGGTEFYGVDHIPLIQDHVAATDPTVIPTGAVNLIRTPASNGNCSLLMTASDIGSAIKGARMDLYTGVGAAAVARSNKLTGAGSNLTLIAKGSGVPIPNCH